MNEGDARIAYRTDSTISLVVPAGVRFWNRRKLVTSAEVRGRRKALRPKVWMVLVRQVVSVAPVAVAAHVVNIDLLAPATTSVATFSAALR